MSVTDLGQHAEHVLTFKDKDNKHGQLETVERCISSFCPPSHSLLSSQPSHTCLSCVSVLSLPCIKPILQLSLFPMHLHMHTHASTHTRAQDSRDLLKTVFHTESIMLSRHQMTHLDLISVSHVCAVHAFHACTSHYQIKHGRTTASFA